jgi:uncharacterized protein (DUF1800 family)
MHPARLLPPAMTVSVQAGSALLMPCFIHRRRFAFVIAITAAISCARHPAVELPVLPESTAPRELTADRQIKQALARLTFGARPHETEQITGEFDRWLKLQLAPEDLSDPAGDSIDAAHPLVRMSAAQLTSESPPLDIFLRNKRRELGLPDTAHYQMTAADSARFKELNDLGNRRQQEYFGAKVARAVLSERQLLEVMTDFWENHFSVYSGKMPTRFTLLEYDRDVIRPHALGRFRDLLGAVAHSPAMLYYLDNWQSRADSMHLTLAEYRALGRARTAEAAFRIHEQARRRRAGLNENYGRELLELHTLGVDGGYTQADVIAAARALTGWSIAIPREGGAFVFRPEWHDAEPKRFLGVTLPAGRGEDDGEEVLDIVSRHPATARFIVTKLVRRFVADTPPASLVARAAAEFQRTDGDIRRVMALIVSSPEFYSRAAYGAKVKEPYALVVSTYRALGGHPDSLGRTVQLSARLGQPLWGRLTPDGWPDDAAAWMNTGAILQRIRFGLDAGAGRLPGIRVANIAASTAVDRVDSAIALVLHGEATSETRSILLTGHNPLATTEPIDAMSPVAPNGAPAQPLTFAAIVGLAIGSPDFQRR